MVGESQSRVVAGVEEFRDVIEQLGGKVDKFHGGEEYVVECCGVVEDGRNDGGEERGGK